MNRLHSTNYPMESLIKHAIKKKRVLSLCYKNQIFLVEPHLFGLHRNGQQVLYAYKMAEGFSQSEGWGEFFLYKMHDLEIMDESFEHTRWSYRLVLEELDLVFCEIYDHGK